MDAKPISYTENGVTIPLKPTHKYKIGNKVKLNDLVLDVVSGPNHFGSTAHYGIVSELDWQGGWIPCSILDKLGVAVK